MPHYFKKNSDDRKEGDQETGVRHSKRGSEDRQPDVTLDVILP